MDDDKIEPYKFKTPWLGKQIARLFLTVATETRDLYRSSRLRLFVAFRLFRGFDLLKRYYLLLLILIAVILFGGLWFELIADLRNVVGRAAKALLDVDLSSDDVRNTVYMLAGGAAALVALATAPFALIKAWVNERLATTAEQGLITDRITRAIEQLGAEKTVKSPDGKEATQPNLEVRLGAIYALERIAQDSERDHIPIMETLCAYIRENSKARPSEDFPQPEWEGLDDYSDPQRVKAHVARRRERFGSFVLESKAWKWARTLDEPRADLQAAVRVIGRRGERRLAFEKSRRFRLDLRAANLRRVDFSGLMLGPAMMDGAKMEGASLYEAKMEGANLREAKMEGADLRGAKMEGADLYKAKMEGANLREAKMEGADLYKAKMEGAYLGGAKMEGADLREAKMEGADLGGAKMEGADLREANLKSADLAFWACARTNARSADFTEAKNMSQEQVNALFGDHGTKPPEGLRRTTLLDREPLEYPWDPDPDYDAWLKAGAPPGTPL